MAGMGGDADEKLLAELGVVATRPDDYERLVIARAQELAHAQELAKSHLLGEEVEEQDVDAALGFLKEGEDRKGRERRGRIQEVLVNLENEIAAVAAGRDVFTGPDSADEKANGADSSKGGKRSRRKKLVSGDGGTAMHLTLLDERLASLMNKRKKLRAQLRHLENKQGGRDGKKAGGQSKKRDTDASASGSQKPQPKVALLCDDDDFDAALDADIARRASSRGAGTSKPSSKGKVASFTEDEDFDAALDAATEFAETERERLIRTGVITPFSKVEGFEKRVHVATRERVPSEEDNELVRRSIANATERMAAFNRARPTTRLLDSSELPQAELPTREFRHLRTPLKRVTAEGAEKPAKVKAKSGVKRRRPQADSKWRRKREYSSDESDSSSETERDKTSTKPKRRRLRRAYSRDVGNEDGPKEEDLEDEDGDEENDEDDVVLDGGLKIPGVIYHKLFDYQKTGLKWMWELHCQKSGGIIGDEMGLGKTVQVTAFLAALHYSGLYRPSIVVCPVTLLRQWKREVKKWYAPFKAEVLHDSAVKGHLKLSKKKNGVKEDEGEWDEDNSTEDEEKQEEERASEEDVKKKGKSVKGVDRWYAMIDRVTNSEAGLLITTYEQLRINRDKLLDINWGYAVLDEGHRIRNPDAEVTLVCKQVQTIHRIIMTGAPIQNRLTELWSLFDFVFPGKLGVLPVFQAQFSLPIQIGGYANATPLQVSTAYKCAAVLRDLILPYLLRRMKVDVNANLPKKTEHVIFCKLSQAQRSAYRAFLGSSEVEQIIEGNRNSLFGIDILRKICNHPDLLEREHGSSHPDYGNPERSGKLKLVSPILSLWKKQGHRVLLFTQTQQMLDIIQSFAEAQGFEYRRMDGSTPVRQRMNLIDEFNESQHVFLFIMTTKVGGLGTNLTGANRVIIFDPDWNPSTDMQARERAWRIGQKKDVTIYRLITQGTIEEKVYHRQIYKQFLTNKILKDPQQRRIFKARDMRDLFTLQEDKSGAAITETASLFGDSVENLMANPEPGNLPEETLSAILNPLLESGEVNPEECNVLDGSSERGKVKVEGEDEEPEEEESRILQDLFAANGIHSAMDHDAIMAVSDKEKVMVDQEAQRVARRASDALRQSRMIRASDNVAVPTWTGRSGEAGAPAGLRRRFGSTTNSRLAASPVTGIVTGQNGAPQEVVNENGTNVRGLAGVVAGSAAGKALSSSDVLSRMRERHMGALGASMESAGPGSRASPSSSVPRFGGGSVQRTGTNLQSSAPHPGYRGALPVPSVLQCSGGRGSAAQFANERGSIGSSFAGQVPGPPSSIPRFGGGSVQRTGRNSQSSSPLREPLAVPSVSQQYSQSADGSGSPPLQKAGPVIQFAAAQNVNGRDSVGSPFAAGRVQVPGAGGLQSGTPNSMLGSQDSLVSAREFWSPTFMDSDTNRLAVRREHLLAQIKAYLVANGGTIASAVIANHFKDRLSPRDFPLFRQLLRETATLQKGNGEISLWTLKIKS